MLPLETLLAFFDFKAASYLAAAFSPLEIALTSFFISFGSSFSFFVLAFGLGKRLAPIFN